MGEGVWLYHRQMYAVPRLRCLIIKKRKSGINISAKNTTRLRNLMLPRSQPATTPTIISFEAIIRLAVATHKPTILPVD